MAILSTAKIVGMLASAKKTGRQVMNAAGEWVAEVVEDFMSGFAGYGWKIWEYVKGKWMLEIDSIRVREQFIVFEMLVSKMRAIIGSLGISQACGKIATVTLSEDGTEYLITLEDETMSFVAHDFMRCQTYTGTKQTFYHVEISSVVDDVVHVPVSEFDRDAEGIVTNPPEPGNDIVQFGNSVNKNRQSAIYIHADESGQPAIDIMFDIDSKDWTGKVKTRLGGDIPGGDGARGFYCENGMIKGTDTSGHTVYCIHPDGSAEFGDGSAKFNADKSGSLAGGAISWAWDASKNQFITSFKNVVIKWEDLDDEVKENLKGEKGDKGDKGDTGEKGGDGTNGADGQDAVMFAIEFYMNGIQFQNIPCDIHSNPIGGNTLTAKLYRISGNTKEEYSEDNWIVTYLKNGSEVISWNVPEVPTASVDISLDRSFEYDSVLVNVYKVIPTNVLVTSGSISKVMSNVPDWLVGWDTNKVQIGSEYMISPKLFTGKNTGTAEEPILTGIVQGDKCITIDGVERSGIFALVNNEVVFELDPETQKYKFKGRVEADEGYFRGLIETAIDGKRILLDPDTGTISMFDADDVEVISLSYLTESGRTWATINIKGEAAGGYTNSTLRLSGSKIELFNDNGFIDLYPNLLRINYNGKIMEAGIGSSRNDTGTVGILSCTAWPTSAAQVYDGQVYSDNGILKVK